jgi:hypothetical protein
MGISSSNITGGSNFNPGAVAITGGTASGLAITGSTIGGVITNSNAAAGIVGEYITSSVASGSAVSLTTNVAINITSISLTAGDWDVFGAIGLLPGVTTSLTFISGGQSSTSATLGALGTFFSHSIAAVVPGAVGQVSPIPTTRVSLAATTTIYLVFSGTFTLSTLGAYGVISARRVR